MYTHSDVHVYMERENIFIQVAQAERLILKEKCNKW